MQASLRTIRLWTAAAAIPFALGACANMADVPPGTSLAEITAQFGEPNYACTNRNGQQRVIWTTQPMGQYAWGANIDSAGNADQVTPLLTTQHFRKLDEGTWTQEQVHCEFGPPAEIAGVGLPSVRQEVWSYRYKEAGAWNSLMHIYFDNYTGEVTRFHSGPDPMFDRENFLFF